MTLTAEDSTSVKPPRDYSLAGRTLFQVLGLPNVGQIALIWTYFHEVNPMDTFGPDSVIRQASRAQRGVQRNGEWR